MFRQRRLGLHNLHHRVYLIEEIFNFFKAEGEFVLGVNSSEFYMYMTAELAVADVLTFDAMGLLIIGENGIAGKNSDTLYSAGFDAAWEIDVFGGTRRSVEASSADWEAMQFGLGAVQVSVATETAQAYLDLRTFQYRLSVAQSNLVVQQDTFEILESRSKREAQQLRDAENNFRVAVGVRGMDVTLHDVVVHQTINHVGGFSFGRAKNATIPVKLTLIQKPVGCHALVFPEVLVRVIGVQ